MKSKLYECCAFTGHRPSKLPWRYDENDKHCIKLRAVLVQQIEKLAAAGVTDFYTGMALGVDTWAAMAVLDLRERNTAIKLHCVLPCEGQEVKWTPSAQVRYRHILSEADSVVYVKRLYDKKCMLERNQRLVDSAAFLLAVYNGGKRGGTAATVRYAQKAGREIIVIDPITRLVSYSETAPRSSCADVQEGATNGSGKATPPGVFDRT